MMKGERDRACFFDCDRQRGGERGVAGQTMNMISFFFGRPIHLLIRFHNLCKLSDLGTLGVMRGESQCNPEVFSSAKAFERLLYK